MGGSKKKTVVAEQVIRYPAGFENLFKQATNVLLTYARGEHASPYFQRLSPYENIVQQQLSNLIQGGFQTPMDRFIQNIYLTRLGLPTIPVSINTPSNLSLNYQQFLPENPNFGKPSILTQNLGRWLR